MISFVSILLFGLLYIVQVSSIIACSVHILNLEWQRTPYKRTMLRPLTHKLISWRLGHKCAFFWCHSANLFRTINEYDVKLWWQGALVITFVNKKYVFLHLCSHRVPLECSQELAEWDVGVPAQQVSQPVCQSISKILRRNFTFFLEISCIWRRKNLGLKSYQGQNLEKTADPTVWVQAQHQRWVF